jgi:hypothetical protein
MNNLITQTSDSRNSSASVGIALQVGKSGSGLPAAQAPIKS